jgi:hypothetical protein
LEWWSGGVVEWWSGGVVEWWSGGVVEWWSGGVLEWWSIGVVETWSKRLEPLLTLPNPSLVTEPLSITLLATMGGYKGRVNVKHRKRRSAKAERIKAVAATKTAAKKSD